MFRYWIAVFALLIGAHAASAQDSFLDGEVEELATGFQFTEGPVWHKDGMLLFSDIPARTIYSIQPDGDGRSAWRDSSGKSNGLTIDTQGRLLACEHWNRRVSRTETDGTITTIAERWQGKRFNSPNDLVVRSDGMIFFTDPDWGLEGRAREIDFNGVYRVMPGEEPVLLVDDFVKPNGIALSPDESTLYVADDTRNEIRAFDVSESGDVSNSRRLTRVSNPDGIKVDAEGRIWTTSSLGVVVYAPDGSRLEVISVPEQPANCGFGDDDMQALYITARNSVYKVRLNVKGLDPWRFAETQVDQAGSYE